MMRFILCCLLVANQLGCRPRDRESTSSIEREPYDRVLVVAVDLSGSFADLLTEEGRAYQLLLAAIDRYFRDASGGKDLILITQLSGNDLPLLWQGTPEQLSREFPDEQAFRTFLLADADPSGSRIRDGVAESLDCAVRNIGDAKVRAVALVLTDWEDNDSDQVSSRERLVRAIRAFSPYGSIGLYFCSQRRRPEIEQIMHEAGARYILVEGHDRNPPLPSLD